MNERKTINITPNDSEVSVSDGEFVLIFKDHNKEIKIHMQRWWIHYIAINLWKVIDRESASIENLKKSMKNIE